MSDRELVYRMRTCAAALVDEQLSRLDRDGLQRLQRDAADILLEASNVLDVPEPFGEPMALIDTPPAKPNQPTTGAMWGGLPPADPRPCPICGSIDARTVRRDRRKLILTCPVCSYHWEYKP